MESDRRDLLKFLSLVVRGLGKESSGSQASRNVLKNSWGILRSCVLCDDHLETAVTDGLDFNFSDKLLMKFVVAASEHLDKLQHWHVYNIESVVPTLGPVLPGVGPALVSRVVATCLCFFAPQKISLQPLLLAKKWNFSFQAAPLPSDVWQRILGFLPPPSTRWDARGIGDWAVGGLGHALFLPAFARGKIFTGGCLLSPDNAEQSKLCQDLGMHGVKFYTCSASKEELWQCLKALAGIGHAATLCPLEKLNLEDTILIACIFTRLTVAAPVCLLEFHPGCRWAQMLRVLEALFQHSEGCHSGYQAGVEHRPTHRFT